MDEYLKMYEGIPFSPVATLTQPVNEADTVIHVSDSGVFPEGPNYATIGSDENAETVFYAQKASGLLSGCTRGVEGIARAWQAEEVIARNFTGLDYRALHKNMDKAISELSGKANTVNNQSPDAKGNIELTAEHIPVEAAGMDAGTVQEAVRILKKDGDEVREYFTPEGAAKNANALNGVPGENYLPEKITDLAGAKSYEYAASMACVARPSFIGRTVQEGTPSSPDAPVPVKGVLNPWIKATAEDGTVVTKQLTGELFDGDSFDGVNLTANGTVSRHDMDLVLSPGSWTIEAGDENGLLESVSIEVLPNSAVYGRRVYLYQHTKAGNVHKLTGTPGAEQIIFRTTGAYQDGDTWTLNGAAVAVTYNDGKKLLPTAVIAGSVVEAAIEGNTVRLMLQKPAPQLSFNQTIYVDAANGNDTTGNGSEAKPYATISKALYSLPKNLGGNTAIIKVADGTYDGFWIVNYFNGSLQINAVTPEKGRVKITSEIVCLGCICGIYFNGLTSVSTANSCFSAQSSQEMSIVNCWATEPAPDTIGIQAAYGSRIMVNTVEISNKKIGANIDYAASLSSHMLTGSGNGIGVNCFSAIVYTSGSITGTTHRQVNYGQIFG